MVRSHFVLFTFFLLLFLFFSSRPKKGEFEKKTHENSSLFFLSVARVSKISSNPFYTRIDLSLSLSLSEKKERKLFPKKRGGGGGL
jgi:hypothetical protein